MKNDENVEAALFMRRALQHISSANDTQKAQLLQALLERPPKNLALDLAEQIWRGLTEKEFMSLCARLQKHHDKDFWQFATRLRDE